MRRLHRLATLPLLLALGCSAAPPSGGVATSPASAGAIAIDAPEKVLSVAFDDLEARIAAAPPLGLTASDGTGLALASLTARAVVDDPLAFTEITLVFDNPSDRTLEGTFSITLPKGAALSRFAMKNADGWQEGEVVEKKQARAAYEDFLHRRQDPALLEQAAGNEFSARVFPIPARGRKELVVSYSHELTRSAPYALPLKGLPPVGHLDVEAYVPGKAAPILAMKSDGAAPAQDFRIDPRLLGDRVGVRSGNLVLARVTPVAATDPEPLGATLVLLDTSASRALGLAEATRTVQRLAEDLARKASPRTPFVVAAYDQGVDAVFDGAAGDVGKDLADKLRQRLALGASDLSAALAWAGDHARARGVTRVVVVTDGVATAGKTAGADLRAIVKGLGGAGITRLDAVALGGIRDDAMLASLVNAGLPRVGVVVDAAAVGPEETWRRLNEATKSGLEVHVEGASFVFPKRFDGVQAGDEVLVYANVAEELPVRLSVGGGPLVAPSLAKVERPLLERAWAGAKLASLVERERVEGPSQATWTEIVGISTRYRVLSPYTSLLVLETENDYARFGIDRRALGEILVADGARVKTMTRPAPQPPKQVVVASAPVPDHRPAPTGHAKGAQKVAPPIRSSAGAVASRPPSKPSAGPVRSALGGASAGFDDEAGLAGPADKVAARDAREEAKKKDSGGPSANGAPAAAPASPPPIAQAEHAAPRPAATSTASVPAPAAPAAAQASPPPPPMARPERHAAEPAPSMEAPDNAAIRVRPGPVATTPIAAEPHLDDDAAEEPGHLPTLAPSDAWDGPFKDVMELVARGQIDEALRAAFAWRKKDPGDVLALVALGEAFEAAGMPKQAARCYGSIIDLFPARADLRRFAGERLERVGHASALPLALDTYLEAEKQRPDHPASHRLAAFALVKLGRPAEAFDAIVRGLRQEYPSGRFSGSDRILREDLGLVGAAWAAQEPKREGEIRQRVLAEGGAAEDEPSIRFVLVWETDANDVDFHIYDARGGHAFYSHPDLPSGGRLYADVTTGYGPECFTIRGAKLAYPYRLQAQYYSRGPMGYGMGRLEVVTHDGHGKLTFSERPYVVMKDHAFVDLGDVIGPKGPKVAR
jgi:hypothetical protein